MKKLIFSMMAAVAVLAGCSKAEFTTETSNEYTFNITVNKVDETKSVRKTAWKDGDKIYVSIYSSKSNCLVLTYKASAGKWVVGYLNDSKMDFAADPYKKMVACWSEKFNDIAPTFYDSSAGDNYSGWKWDDNNYTPFYLCCVADYTVEGNVVSVDLKMAQYAGSSSQGYANGYTKFCFPGLESGKTWRLLSSTMTSNGRNGILVYGRGLMMKNRYLSGSTPYFSVTYASYSSTYNTSGYPFTLLKDDDGSYYVFGLTDCDTYGPTGWSTVFGNITLVLSDGTSTYTKTFSNVAIMSGGGINIQGPSASNLNGWTKN